MQKSTIDRIERMCREFLWGHNKNGGRKIPLIAWKRLTKLKKHGGLGIKDTTVHATALMARWPIKLITDKNSIWSRVFKANLESLPWKNKKKHKKLGYSFLDKLLFSQPFGFSKLQYSKNIWNAWSDLRKFLIYEIEGNKIPGHWAIDDAVKLTQSISRYSASQQARIVYFFGRIQVTSVKDLWNHTTNSWNNFDTKLLRTRGLPEWAHRAIKTLIAEFNTASGVCTSPDSELLNWKWKT
jgi:hypothetical protein